MPQAIRRFSLLDAMLLIAATAVGIVAVRAIFGQMRLTQYGFHHFTTWVVLASPLVGLWSLALLLAALARPEARGRRMFRRPGITASCTFWIVFFLGNNAGFLWLNPGSLVRLEPSTIFIFWDQAAYQAGLSVVAVWIAQALAGWWRPAPNWIDRAGRISGVFWIVTYIIRQLNI